MYWNESSQSSTRQATPSASGSMRFLPTPTVRARSLAPSMFEPSATLYTTSFSTRRGRGFDDDPFMFMFSLTGNFILQG